MSIISILQLAAALLTAIPQILQSALAAHSTGDQAALDAAHNQLLTMANALRPTGATPAS